MDRSISITLAGKDYEFQFLPEDVEACETDLQMGYLHFFRVEDKIPIYLSLKFCRSIVHHGLKVKDAKGDLEYAFPQSPIGSKQAADLIKSAMQQDGKSMITVWVKAHDAYLLDWFEKPKEGDKPGPVQENPSKNSHGTGSKRQNR